MKIKNVKVNNHKKALEIETRTGRILSLPFSRLKLRPTSENKIVRVYVDRELAHKGITYVLETGKEDSVHLDAFLDYHRDPDFLRQVSLHKLTIELIKLIKVSGLSKHEVIRRLHTSPSQLYRLLDPTNNRKSIDEMLKLLSVLGYEVELSVIKKAA